MSTAGNAGAKSKAAHLLKSLLVGCVSSTPKYTSTHLDCVAVGWFFVNHLMSTFARMHYTESFTDGQLIVCSHAEAIPTTLVGAAIVSIASAVRV